MARIAVIDDDPLICAMLKDLLEKTDKSTYNSEWKITVTTIPNAIEALKIFEAGFNFELIVTDVLMARIDGWTLIKELRKKYTQAMLPIIVISAIDGMELEYQSIRAGASAWFTKPIDLKRFCDVAFNLIAGR